MMRRRLGRCSRTVGRWWFPHDHDDIPMPTASAAAALGDGEGGPRFGGVFGQAIANAGGPTGPSAPGPAGCTPRFSTRPSRAELTNSLRTVAGTPPDARRLSLHAQLRITPGEVRGFGAGEEEFQGDEKNNCAATPQKSKSHINQLSSITRSSVFRLQSNL